jgi:hypothetical protein
VDWVAAAPTSCEDDRMVVHVPPMRFRDFLMLVPVVAANARPQVRVECLVLMSAAQQMRFRFRASAPLI